MIRTLSFAVLTIALATSAQAELAGHSPGAIAATVDPVFSRFVADMPVPGLAYGVVRDGQMVHFRAQGMQSFKDRRPVDRNSRFRLASMSKAFTALAILKLRDDGKLRLDDLAEQYIPEMRHWRYPTADSTRIRIRDLLAHTAGFVNDDPWADRQGPTDAEFGRMIEAGVPFSRPPGIAMEYSNFGYALLGRIITRASGEPYETYIGRYILRPLGMLATGYDVPNSDDSYRVVGYRFDDGQWSAETPLTHGAFGAMGGMWTTADDYARWVVFLLSAWPARDGPDTGPVRRSTVRELGQGLNFPSASQRPRDGNAAPCQMPTAYGMGMLSVVDCELGPLLMHGGGLPGYGSFVILFPERGTGLFAFTNRTYAAPAPALVGSAVALDAAGMIPRRATEVSLELDGAYQALKASWRAQNIEPARKMLSPNFLVDRSEQAWMRELRRLREAAGRCKANEPLTAESRLAGTFRWSCELGELNGRIMLAPTRPATIQSISLATSAKSSR